MSISKRSSSATSRRGSCNESYQAVWEVPGVAETIFVRYEPRSPPGAAHAHAKCSVHLVFLRGAGVLRHTDAEGRFHATEIEVSSGERWVAIDLEPGSYYQVDVSGSDTGLEVIMSLTPPYSAKHRRALSREENDRRGWAFAFASHFAPLGTERPDYLAPDGSEIRLIADFDAGGLCHCALPSGIVTAPVRHRAVEEIWYVVAGKGRIWREGVGETAVEPGTAVTIPARMAFQFRCDSDEALEMVLLTLPKWPGPEEACPVENPHWPVTAARPATSVAMAPADLALATAIQARAAQREAAPDGSTVVLLPKLEAGQLTLCQFPAGSVSTAVRHRTVHEIWYCLEGSGSIWQRAPSGGRIDELRRGVAVAIPPGAAFQFRARRDLEILIATMPKWPGEDEAVESDGIW